MASLDPSLIGYDEARSRAFYDQLVDHLEGMPGVRSVGLAQGVPLGFQSRQRGVDVPGYDPGPDERISIDFNVVAPGYFEVMAIVLKAGRTFDSRDDEAGAPVVIINEALAERFFPDGSALGKVMRTAGEDREIVGITATGKYASLGESPPRIYVLGTRADLPA